MDFFRAAKQLKGLRTAMEIYFHQKQYSQKPISDYKKVYLNCLKFTLWLRSRITYNKMSLVVSARFSFLLACDVETDKKGTMKIETLVWMLDYHNLFKKVHHAVLFMN